jgi:putative transcriptional regulator
MSPQNIQKIEQGDAKSLTFMTLGRLCKVLVCQPGDLLIYEDEPDDNDDLEVISKVQTAGQSKQNRKKDSSKLHKRAYSFLTVIPEEPESA